MITAIQMGPLLLPFTLLLVLALAGSTLALGKWLSKSSTEVDTALWQALLVGVVLARLAFVYEYRGLYLSSPLSIVDIRDGGWNSTFGLVGAWMFALYRERRTPTIKRPVRSALSLGTAILLVGTIALALQGSSGQKLPELAFTSLEGKIVHLKEFEGKPTVINLWATWCPPCVREMPVLHEAQRQHQEVNFVFLNQGEEPEQVSHWLGSQRLPLRNVLLDQNAPSQRCLPTARLPDHLLFNAKGELVSSRIGELLPPRSRRDWKPWPDECRPTACTERSPDQDLLLVDRCQGGAHSLARRHGVLGRHLVEVATQGLEGVALTLDFALSADPEAAEHRDGRAPTLQSVLGEEAEDSGRQQQKLPVDGCGQRQSQQNDDGGVGLQEPFDVPLGVQGF